VKFVTDRQTQAYHNIANLKKIRGSFVKVGFPEGGTLAPATRKGSAHDEVSDMGQMAMIAGVHEYGSEKHNIPERSFMRTAVDENVDKLNELKRRLFGKLLDGAVSGEQALGLLGEFLVGRIRRKITEITSPPLAPATVARKRSSKPLIDSGQMRASVQYKVVMR
jgi:hypothetical protein